MAPDQEPSTEKEDVIARLRAATATLHQLAERGGFNQTLFAGQATKSLYTAYLRHKYHLYAALEALLDQQDHPAIKQLTFPELTRTAAIAQDLDQLQGKGWKDAAPLSAVQAHTYRLRTLAQDNPILLLAHAYTNYLADLSGGLIIKKILQERYGYEEHELQTYTFPIKDIDAFKQTYHERLKEMLGEASLAAAFIEEVKIAYIYAIAALHELTLSSERGEQHAPTN